MTIEEEEKIVENYCKTRNMCLITVGGLSQITEEATQNGYKKGYDSGYKDGYDTAYKEWR